MGVIERLKHSSNYELLDMVNRRYRFSKEVLIELLKELDKREISNDRVEELRSEYPEYRRVGSINRTTEQPQEATAQQNAESLPRLFSIRSIFFFSIIFSTFFASILMAFNLNVLKQRKSITPLVTFGLFYTAMIASISQYLPSIAWFLAILLNGIGAYLIVRFFWNSYVGLKNYESRPVTIPLLIGIGISLPLIYLLSQYGMVM